jgi:hypothetical protein
MSPPDRETAGGDVSEPRTGGASEKAVEAAARDMLATKKNVAAGLVNGQEMSAGLIAFDALVAAHDPALGLDRSVRLRDVVEALREVAANANYMSGDVRTGLPLAADFIAREFGKGE